MELTFNETLTSCACYFVLRWLYKIDSINPILQVSKLKLSEVRWPAQDHARHEW